MPTDERVLVIPTAHFEAVGSFQGFHPTDADFRSRLLDPRQFRFIPRVEAEGDVAFRQLIPYVVLRCGDELFHYRRGAAGTEARLRSLRSVGIGGHISDADAIGPADLYTNGMRRELAEEVTIGGGYREQFLGFINDDRTPVGRVHLGVVHLFELESPEVRSNEDALAEGKFDAVSELWREREQFETWSQFALEALTAPSRAG